MVVIIFLRRDTRLRGFEASRLRGFDLIHPGARGNRIDGLIEANLYRHRLDVDGAADVRPLTTGVALER